MLMANIVTAKEHWAYISLMSRTMQDTFRCDTNSDFLRRFRLNIQANGHVDRVQQLLGHTCIQQTLPRYGDLSTRAHEAHIRQRPTKRLLEDGVIERMTVRHNENVIALIEKQRRSNVFVIAQDNLLCIREIFGLGKLGATLEKSASEAHRARAAMVARPT